MGEKDGLSIGLLYEAILGIILNLTKSDESYLTKIISGIITIVILGTILVSISTAILNISNLQDSLVAILILIVLPFITILIVQIYHILK